MEFSDGIEYAYQILSQDPILIKSYRNSYFPGFNRVLTVRL